MTDAESSQFAALLEALQTLTRAVDRKTERFRRLLYAVLVVLLLSLVVQLTNRQILDKERESQRIIFDCTTAGSLPPPNTGHKCFDDNQKRTGKAVAAIVDTNGNGVPDMQELAHALGVTLPTTTTPAP